MADANTLRRLNWLWKYRHRHDDNFQEQINVIRTTIEQQADSIAGAAYGTYLHAVANSQSITSGGTAVEWANTYGQIPASGPTEVAYPSTDIRIGLRGYYNVDVSLNWDTYQGGGSVTVVRLRGSLETTVWPPAEVTDWDSDDAQVFWGQAPAIPCEPGDIIRVYVDADSTETLAGAVCAVYLVDREENTGGGCVDILGGTATQPGDGYIYHQFVTSGTLTVNQPGVIEYVIVGAGGGGGGAYGDGAGGASEEGPGGGGQVITGSVTVAVGDYAGTVGAGGAGGTREGAGAGDADAGSDGGSSTLETVGTAAGGGGGGSTNEAARTGASGGGGAYSTGGLEGGAVGTAGGDGGDGDTSSPFNAGGGGGAGQDGSDASAGSHGGDGVEVAAFSTFGDSGWFGGGGGGGEWGAGGNTGDGGQGGGGSGAAESTVADHGDANTGGGGAGAFNQQFGNGADGGDGGSGVVIVRYPEC